MCADVFISYAWTSDEHRQWVHLLAAQLKGLGFDVLVDANVDYGSDLTGFMRKVADSEHVLLIVDENYVERANNCAGSGVELENKWINEVYENRDPAWLSVLFKDNPSHGLPPWLAGNTPKGFDFNYDGTTPDRFPGSEQVEDLWRWIEGLPANRDSATPIATLRERAVRLEEHALRADSARWRSSSLSGEVRFDYEDAPGKTFRWGFGISEFKFQVSGRAHDSVYVYRDPIKAVGIVRGEQNDDWNLARHLSSGRNVVAKVGQSVVLLNHEGRLAVVEILEVQQEVNESEYVAPSVAFKWRVIEDS